MKKENQNNNFEDLEKEWLKNTPKFTDKELLEIFPEAKECLAKKIKKLETIKKELIEVIKKKLDIVEKKSTPNNQWFWYEVIKAFEGQDLLEIENKLIKIKYLLSISYNKKAMLKNKTTKQTIERLLNIPIENIISGNTKLRKVGKNLLGLCPFHNEKSPSFYIYTETNSFYCFGCQTGGNVINLAMKLYGYSFKEAVRFLNNN